MDTASRAMPCHEASNVWWMGRCDGISWHDILREPALIPTLLPKGEGIFSPLPLGEGAG